HDAVRLDAGGDQGMISRQCIVERRRKRMLGRQAIVESKQTRVAPPRQPRGHGAMSLRGHGDISPAVKIKDAAPPRRMVRCGGLDPFAVEGRIMLGANSPAARKLRSERHPRGERARLLDIPVALRSWL